MSSNLQTPQQRHIVSSLIVEDRVRVDFDLVWSYLSSQVFLQKAEKGLSLLRVDVSRHNENFQIGFITSDAVGCSDHPTRCNYAASTNAVISCAVCFVYLNRERKLF